VTEIHSFDWRGNSDEHRRTRAQNFRVGTTRATRHVGRSAGTSGSSVVANLASVAVLTQGASPDRGGGSPQWPTTPALTGAIDLDYISELLGAPTRSAA
jgi:hypothetical protein